MTMRLKMLRGQLVVVIPSYGRADLTHQLLRDVVREPWVDIVVVDNLGDLNLSCAGQVLTPGRNLGWAGGCNFALHHLLASARHEAFVLLNNDTRLSRGFFRELWTSWRDSLATVLGPTYDGVWPVQRSAYSGSAYRYRPVNAIHNVPFLDGTCLFLPRSTVVDVGLLDDATFPRHGWGVDFDYALRVRKAGGTLKVTQRAFVHHIGNGTSGLQLDGWREHAWEEMTRGMRAKWGVAWPRLMRGPSANGENAGLSGSGALPSQPAVFVLATNSRAAGVVARAVNLAGVPPIDPEVGRAVLYSGHQALQRARAANGAVSADPEALLAAASVAQAVDDVALRLGPRRPTRSWFCSVGPHAELVPFIAAALAVQPVCVHAVSTASEPVLDVLSAVPILNIALAEAAAEPAKWADRLRTFLLENGLPLIGGALDARVGATLAVAGRALPGDAVTTTSVAHIPEQSEENAMTTSCLNPEWVSWVRYNRDRGVGGEAMIQVLVANGVEERLARAELVALHAAAGKPTYRPVNHSAGSQLAPTTLQTSPQWLDPEQARAELAAGVSLPWDEIRSCLCLASGGGRHAPAVALLGVATTVVDPSPQQLALDRKIASSQGLDLECIQADINDLTALDGRRFDLVYQPVSTCYLSDPQQVYTKVAALTHSGGSYWIEHWNPLQMQLGDRDEQTGDGYNIVRPIDDGERIAPPCDDHRHDSAPDTGGPQIHSLETLLGGMCLAGFEVVDLQQRQVGNPLAPIGSDEHLASFVPPSFIVLGRRTSG